MKPLSPADSLFLLLERRNQPMHVGGLVLLRPKPEERDDFLAAVAARARAATKAYAPFNQRLVRRMGIWFWEEDRHFDIEAHVHHIALPKPGRIRELLALVSKLHSGLMDRAKPLWEMFLIEGVEDGRAAVYFKMHHSMADGVAAARMMQKAMSDDPDHPLLTPIWAMPPAERVLPRKESRGLLAAAGAAAREQARALPTVLSEVARSLRGDDPDDVSVFQAPPTLLNRRVSASRRFAAQSWSLPRIREAARAHNVTINDIVLAMCGSALRRYLLSQNALPRDPLVAMVPVSLRRDDSDEGNQLGMVLANLGTDIANPSERLRAINRSMKTAKHKFSGMTQLEIMEYVSAMHSFSGLNIATGLLPSTQSFNTIISNVPGPKKTLYFNGARVEGVYPVSIIVDGQALNLTMQSYGDQLDFGLIACSRTLPHMQYLLQYLENGLTELEPVRPRKPAKAVSERQPAKPAKKKAAKPVPKTSPKKDAKAAVAGTGKTRKRTPKKTRTAPA